MDFVLGKIELHRIVKDQSNVSAESAGVTHVEVCLRSLLHVFKAHRRFDDLGIAWYEVLYRVSEDEPLVFIRHVLYLLGNDACALLLATFRAVVLEGVITIDLEPCKNVWVFKDAVTLEVHALSAVATGYDVLSQIGCQSRLIRKDGLWPEAITDKTVLLILSLLVAWCAELKVLGPLVEPVLASLSRAAALTLNASLAGELIFTREAAGQRELGVRVKAFVVIGRVTAAADHELLRRSLARASQAVDTPYAVGASPFDLSDAEAHQVSLLEALLMPDHLAAAAC